MAELPRSGDPAPEFTLPSAPEASITLGDLRGRPVVLAFYPADFSPVCSDQMALYQAVKPEFDRYDAVVLGISVDGVWCHRAFADSRNLRFPLLSDFEPKGEVARAYGSFDAITGEALRTLFVLDRDGKVFWSEVSPPGVNPGADGILAALDAMAAATAGAAPGGSA
ncbi:redoxin domain-containing protein [Hamadaea tsunoensis]|uniref:redoxin domain-containing protein n=1 Tax=Hamadaea tsunoensis TaxID=53368 RepID=UPI00041BAC4E|nr:redoxin domain-containing protein [Hamadaea tsunoensis]